MAMPNCERLLKHPNRNRLDSVVEMGKTKVIELTAEQRAELEKGYRIGKSHCFRTRCQMILLKSEKRTSVEVAEILGCCEMVEQLLPEFNTRKSATLTSA